MNWSAVREQFPALANWTYLNTASFGQVPERSRAAMNRHFDRRNELACMDFIEWFDDMDGVRSLAARLIECSPEDIAFIPNASSALSLLLGGLEWKPGDRIITLTDEFPNQYYFASHLRRLGVELVEVPFERFYESVDERTRVVALSGVNYTTGFRAPLQEIAPFLRSRGVMLYVDGTQSVGALPIDVGVLQPDMLAVHGYKWLLSPNGAGFVYVHPELRAKLEPSVIGWRSDRNWRAVDSLHHGEPVFETSAARYEGGMLTFAVLYAMAESIAMILEIGKDKIEQRVLQLSRRVCEVVERAGASVAYPDSPIIAARFDTRDAVELAEKLKSERVLVAARHGNLRISPHFYNDESDIDRFAAALAR